MSLHLKYKAMNTEYVVSRVPQETGTVYRTGNSQQWHRRQTNMSLPSARVCTPLYTKNIYSYVLLKGFASIASRKESVVSVKFNHPLKMQIGISSSKISFHASERNKGMSGMLYCCTYVHTTYMLI